MATIPAVPQKQPLPLNPFDEQDQPDLHDAYDQCLASEREAGSEQELMCARCLGYFLIEAPVVHGQHTVAKDILLCNGDKRAMDHLAQLYINHIILLFRQNKGKTPAPSYHPSRPSFDDNSLFYSATIEPAPQDHRAAKLAALERDGYNCMVTGLHDKGKYIQLTPADRAARGWNRLSMKTNFCHIFPPSTNWELELNEPNHPKTTHAEHMWNLIYAFGGIQVLDELNGDSIHRLSNGLTLAIHVHD
ncbi:hypothetical protein D9756_009749 [Leucocoprinus leucothites]|uniref:HNH nuclease domain-containing protein n=1 Tax=Leucocoprinus leucothites TaxID=201217 RepID=A0A8H5CX66_9AGAR|nr:hypothetical protein D9756_009749 [Leucoagaricus leucothites]